MESIEKIYLNEVDLEIKFQNTLRRPVSDIPPG